MVEEKRKCKIFVPQGCRSDKPLSDPVIKRLKACEEFEVIVPELIPTSFGDSYDRIKALALYFKPDVLFATGDRIEMTAAACAAFHTSIPIIHYGAGIVNTPIATWDDINRHCISLWSEVQLCEDNFSLGKSNQLINAIGGKPNGRVVGHTHCDDLEVDESLVPEYEYDLVLYNPTTMYEEDIEFILLEGLNKNTDTIWIGSNPDPSHNIHIPINYENLPRPQFLGLLKNCKRYISNSSNTYYEAPYFLKPEQIINIGDRNCARSTKFEGKPGASDKIVSIIKEWWRDKCESH